MTNPAARGRTANNIELNPVSPEERYNNSINMQGSITLEQSEDY